MINQEKKTEYYSLLFKINYLLLTFLSFDFYTAKTYLVKLFALFIILFGIFVLFLRVKTASYYMDTPGILFLILFLISYDISLLANLKYGFFSGVKGMIWLILEFFILYAFSNRKAMHDEKKDLFIISLFIIAYTFIAAFISIIMLLTNFATSRQNETGNDILAGFVFGRLWGVYTNHNYGAILAVVSIILSLFMLYKSDFTLLRVSFIINIVLQFLYVAFSNSTTGLVALLITTSAYTFFVLLRFIKQVITKKIIIASMACILMFVATLSTYFLVKASFNKVRLSLGSTSVSDNILYNDNVGQPAEDTENNLNNRRFDIWQSGLEIFITKPIIGVSFGNINSYAKQNLPETYIVNNDFTEFDSLNNDFINIFVSQGILGFIIFIAVIASISIFIFKRIFILDDTDYYLAVTLLCCVSALVVSMFFYSDIIYINSPLSIIFWILLSSLTAIIYINKKQAYNDAKVGITTFHRARNYGACLQTLALQYYIERKGIPVHIIDYRPSYIEDNFKIFKNNFYTKAKGDKTKLREFYIKTILKLPVNLLREYKFKKFRENYFNLTSSYYFTDETQNLSCLNHRLYIFGSDQIFNPMLTNNLDSVYFGKTFSDLSYKASYAASVGIDNIEKYMDSFIKNLTYLNAVSVRENEAKKLLAPLTDKPIEVVCDPTLLLARDEYWRNIAATRINPKRYICAYCLEITDTFVNTVKALADAKNMEIVFFNLKNRYGKNAKSYYTADPLQFLSLLGNAEYVVTNSFHGTIFSIIFRRKFLNIPSKKASVQASELLHTLELESRIINDPKKFELIDQKIDYDKVHDMLSQFTVKSKEYIDYILQKVKILPDVKH